MSNNKPKLCMISGSFEYDSEGSLTIFHNYMEQNHGIRSSMIIYKTEDDDIPLEPIDDTDVLLVFTRRLNTEGKELERFKAYCAQGRPIMGVRTASHAFQKWLAFDKEVLGGNYHGHYGRGPTTTVTIADGGQEHPILAGAKTPLASKASLYKTSPLAKTTKVLLMGTIPDQEPEPVAWTNTYGKSRVFYTSLGSVDDFNNTEFRRLLINAVFWAMNKPVPKP